MRTIGFVTHSEFLCVYKSTSKDQGSPSWSSSNRHPVSIPPYSDFSSSPFHPFHLLSHLFLSIHLLLVYLGGSAVTPSHIQKGRSVVIPRVQRL
jgi:hypothetical protein